MKKVLNLFGTNKDRNRREDFPEDEYYDDDIDYRESDEDYDSEDYEDDDYEEDEDYVEDEEDYVEEDYEDEYEDEEYSQEEMEEYYEKSAARESAARQNAVEEAPEEEKDYEFSDDDEDDYPDEEYDREEDYEEEYEDDYVDDDYEDEDYEDEDYDEDEDDEDSPRGYGRGNYRSSGNGRRSYGKENKAALVLSRFLDAVKNSSAVERIAAVFAILLITGAAVTAILYSSAMNKNDELSAFAEVGTSMAEVQVVGQSGLIAIADAQKAKMMAAELISEEEQEEEEVVEEKTATVVKVTLTSIKSDIKVKFIDTDTDKLIGNVPFEIKVVNPDGTTVTYDDHDRDGIIYKTKLTAGTYKITPKELPAGYEDYQLSLDTQTIKVKDTVEMKAVDVKNEIKDESQINVAKEEAKGGQETESELQDTVDWDGESWVKDGESDGTVTYKEVKKEDVPEPSGSSRVTVSKLPRFSESLTTDSASAELTYDIGEEEPGEEEPVEEEPKEISLDKTSYSLVVGETDTIRASADATLYFSTSNSDVVYVDEDGRLTGAGEGSATITISAEGYKDAYVSVTVTKKEEQQEEEVEIKKVPLETYSLSLYVKETAKIKCTEDSVKCKYSSDNEDVVKVDKKGNVTAVGEGTATITVTAKGYEEARVEVTVVKRTDGGVVPIEIQSLTLYERQTKKIKAKESGLKLLFSSSDKNVAKVADDGTITAVSKGTCKITVSAEGYEDAVIDVTVVHQELKDKDGNTLYVMEKDGSYRVATYADYSEYKSFYKKVENTNKVYHGWATIDGRTYFFDNSGNYVTGEQVINHVKYVFGSDGVLAKSAPTVGIDVSKHNGSIDWKAVKNSGVNFAIIRCGYRGYSTGVMVEDPAFKTNIRGALGAGLRVGVYYYSQAVDEVEAVEEASMVINLLSGYGIQLPVYMDVEASGGRGDQISVSQRTANIRAFCGTIQSAGYKAGVYANKAWLTSYINTSQISNYNIWLAQYAKEVSYSGSRYDMWQYTSKGRVSGISGNVDMNICY